MAKRNDKSRFELEELGFKPRREDEYLERLVLPSDTLQGIALLYNTTIAELKKINHIVLESELHARRVIKVPSKGILVDLTDDLAKPPPSEPRSGSSVNVEFLNEDSGESDHDNNGQVYLNNVDSVVKELKEKAQIAADKSPVLNGSDSPLLSRKDLSKKRGELQWWKILLPCLAVLIIFPVLYYLYREQAAEVEGEENQQQNITNNTVIITQSKIS